MDFDIYINPFDPKSYDAAAKKLREIKTWYEERLDRFAMTLAERGAEAARMRFATASDMDPDDQPPTVSVQKTETGYSIVAEGDDVIFLEFGAGDDARHEQASEFGYGPGSWSGSALGSGMYIKYGSWEYVTSGGERIHRTGRMPSMAMNYAVEYMRNHADDVAREVFS